MDKRKRYPNGQREKCNKSKCPSGQRENSIKINMRMNDKDKNKAI